MVFKTVLLPVGILAILFCINAEDIPPVGRAAIADIYVIEEFASNPNNAPNYYKAIVGETARLKRTRIKNEKGIDSDNIYILELRKPMGIGGYRSNARFN